MKKSISFILVMLMVLCMVPGVALAEGYVAKIDSTEYTTFDDAIKAANGMTGDVTVEIYGKVEYTNSSPKLTGAYDSISFVGKTNVAEISITRSGGGGYISGGGQDCAVNFIDLICSRPNGKWASDGAHMCCYFTVYRVGDVSYTNCTFPNGACCQGNKATYTNCTFNNTDTNAEGKFSLWVYGANTECIVNGGTFSGIRGIKMYAEGMDENTYSSLTVTGATFTADIIQKAAVVLTKAKKVELNKNTYNNSLGVVAIDKEGEGIDSEPTAATIIVEGKEYKVGTTSGAMPGDTIYVESTPSASPDISDDPNDNQPTEKPQVTPTPKPKPTEKPASSGIKVEYEGGNSFSTSKSDVPTSVEIDGVPVSFTGNGSSFTVGCIDPNAKWVTVKWNSTTVTVNFTPDVNVVCTEIGIPKTGDMPFWAAIAAFFGF